MILELFTERSDVVSGIVIESLEETGLANAIRYGRKNQFVREEEIGTTYMGKA